MHLRKDAKKCPHCGEWQGDREEKGATKPTNYEAYLLWYKVLIFFGLAPVLGGAALCALLSMFQLVFSSSIVSLKAQDAGPGFEVRIANREQAILLIPANGGGDKSPWIRTGIQVSKGDVLKIHASGKIHTALHRMVEYANRDEPSPIPWTSPSGTELSLKTSRVVDEYRIQFFLAKDSFRGALLGCIAQSDQSLPREPASYRSHKADERDAATVHRFEIGDRFEGEALVAGELFLTTNEIWLGIAQAELAFAPPLQLPGTKIPEYEKRMQSYYIDWLNRVKTLVWPGHIERAGLSVTQGQDCLRAFDTGVASLSQAKHDKSVAIAAKIARDVKVKLWRKVLSPASGSTPSPHLYYDDNGGAYTVLIERKTSSIWQYVLWFCFTLVCVGASWIGWKYVKVKNSE